MSKKDNYGPPLEESSKRAITAKQVLQTPASSTSLQAKFTPLTPLALPTFYPSSSSYSPRAIRPSLNSKLVSPLTFALNTPSALNNQKLPFYTPPDSLSCPFIEKDYKKILKAHYYKLLQNFSLQDSITYPQVQKRLDYFMSLFWWILNPLI